jgi:hypothetical protein
MVLSVHVRIRVSPFGASLPGICFVRQIRKCTRANEDNIKVIYRLHLHVFDAFGVLVVPDQEGCACKVEGLSLQISDTLTL